MSQLEHQDNIISAFSRVFDKLDILNYQEETELWDQLMRWVYHADNQ